MEVKVIKRKTATDRKLKVAAYARVSGDTEEQDGSIEKQIEHYEDLIKNNPDYEFVEVYFDQGISGFKERRPGFQRMISDARAGKIDLIITKSITRFARNTDTFLKTLRELKGKGIGVFFELQNINSLSESGELLMTVYAAFAQGESETYRGLALMRFKKRFGEGRPEYQMDKTLGYTKDKDGKIVIVPEEAEIVKQLFTWVKENYETKTIRKMAERCGFKRKSGKPMNTTFIMNTIKNVVYKGDYIMQRTYTDETRKTIVNQDVVPSYYIENDHPAIISRRLWKEANEVLDKRRMDRENPIELKPATIENYPYKDRLYCAKCGRKMNLVNSKRQIQYHFTCRPRKIKGKTFCPGTTVPQLIVESWGPITENIYINHDPDKPLHKQYSYVKESTWKKDHKRKEIPKAPEYNIENYPYYRRIFCAECGSMLTRRIAPDGRVHFICGGRARHGVDYCSGVCIPEEKMKNLPEWDGYYWFKEEKKNGEKHYSYSCKKERPIRKGLIKE